MAAAHSDQIANDEDWLDDFDLEDRMLSDTDDSICNPTGSTRANTTTTATRVPTKSGETDLNDRTLFKDERPSSAGTGKSIPLDAEDIDVMRRNAVRDAVAVPCQPTNSSSPRLLARFDPPSPEKDFIFLTAIPRQNIFDAGNGQPARAPNDKDHGNHDYESVEHAPKIGLQDVQKSQSPNPRPDPTRPGALYDDDRNVAPNTVAAEHSTHAHEPPSQITLPANMEDDNSSSSSIQVVSEGPVNACAIVSADSTATQSSRGRPGETNGLLLQTAYQTPNPAPPQSVHGMNLQSADQNQHSVDAIRALRKVSDQQGSVRVTKRSPQMRHREPAIRTAPPNLLDEHVIEIFDYIQILGHKFLQKERLVASQVESMHRTHKAELCHVLKAKDNIEQQLSRTIADAEEQRHALITKCNKTAERLRSFQTALGNDFTKLQAEAAKTHADCKEYLERLVKEEMRRKDLEGLLKSFEERNAELKENTAKLAGEYTSQLKTATHTSELLEAELRQKATLLDHERNRRSELESQVQSQVALELATTDALQKIKDEVSSKLVLFHTALEDNHRSSELASMLDKTHAAVVSLNPQSTASAQDLASLKSSIDTLSHSLRHDLQNVKAQADDNITSQVKRSIDEALSPITSALGPNYGRQTIADRATLIETQEKLAACHEHILKLNADTVNAQIRIETLNAEKMALQSTVATSESACTSTDGIQTEMDQLRARFAEQTALLESTRLDMTRNKEDLSNMTAANRGLQEELDQLRAQLVASQGIAKDFEIERTRLYEQHKREAEEAREEMQLHVERFEMGLKTKTENDVKRLESERNRLREQTQELQQKLSKSTAKVAELNASNRQDPSVNQELAQAKNEIAILKMASYEYETISEENAALSARCSSLSQQIDDGKNRVAALREENCTLLEQMERLQHDSEEAALASNDYRVRAQEALSMKENEIKELTVKSHKAIKAANQAAGSIEQHQPTVREVVGNASMNEQQMIRDLREKLTSAQAELQVRHNEDEKLRADTEKTRDAEKETSTRLTDDLRRQLRAVAAENCEVVQKHGLLQSESMGPIEMQPSVIKHVETTNEPTNGEPSAFKTVALRPRDAVAESNNLTVPLSTSTPLPTRYQRTQIDREATQSTNTICTAGEKMPVLQTHCTLTDHGSHRGLGGADAQVLQGTLPLVSGMSESRSRSFLSDGDDMLSLSGGEFQLMSQGGACAPTQDDLPSFSVFKTRLISSVVAEPSSPGTTLPFVEDSQEAHKEQTSLLERRHAARQDTPGVGKRLDVGLSSDEFAVLEQSRPEVVEETQDDLLTESQKPTDYQEWQTPFTHSKSNWKQVQASGNNPRHGHCSDIAQQMPRQARHSAMVAKQAIESVIRKEAAASSPSSSTAYINLKSGPTLRPSSHSRNADGDAQTVRSEGTTAADVKANTVQQTIGTKRRVEHHQAEGSRRSASRRRILSSQEKVAYGGSYALRSSTGHAAKDTPGTTGTATRLQHPAHNRSVTNRDEGLQRRASQLSTRLSRGSKKKPSRDEYAARFQQELGRRQANFSV